MSTASQPIAVVRDAPQTSSSADPRLGAAARHPDDREAPDVVKVLRDDGSLDPASDPHLSEAEVLRLYRAMVRTRLIDERLTLLQRQGRIGFHIGSLGEEAAVIGSAHALRERDWLFPCYREFGAVL